MQAANLDVRPDWIAHCPNTLQHAYKATEQILSRKPRLTAIACANDIMAFGAKRYIESLGLEIGTDISLTGYDDTPVAELIDLTSISQPIAQIATKIIELLLAELTHARPAESHIMLEPGIVIRESSARSRKSR